MRLIITHLLILVFSSSLVSAGDVSLCDLDKNLYLREIEPKITSGVPFELMAVLISQGQIAGRRVLHINYNLWDEVISVRTYDRNAKSFPLARGSKGICDVLSFKSNGTKDRVRLLLNPMWSERIARLHLSVRPDLENKKLIGIDWNKIIQDMPSEKTLFEAELP